MIFIQARMGSERLPGKVLMEVDGARIIDRVIEASLKSAAGHNVVVLLPEKDRGSELHRAVLGWKSNDVKVFFGSENNVALRFEKAFHAFSHILFEEDERCGLVRVCADRPFLQTSFLDELDHSKYQEDLLFNHSPMCDEVGPTGLGAESIRKGLARRVFNNSGAVKLSPDHVTLKLYSDSAVTRRWVTPPELPRDLTGRFDVDEETDIRETPARQVALRFWGLLP